MIQNPASLVSHTPSPVSAACDNAIGMDMDGLKPSVIAWWKLLFFGVTKYLEHLQKKLPIAISNSWWIQMTYTSQLSSIRWTKTFSAEQPIPGAVLSLPVPGP